MATFGDNIRDMAEMVNQIKRTYHLSEGTILRIIDMNFALAQQNPFTHDPENPEVVDTNILPDLDDLPNAEENS